MALQLVLRELAHAVLASKLDRRVDYLAIPFQVFHLSLQALLLLLHGQNLAGEFRIGLRQLLILSHHLSLLLLTHAARVLAIQGSQQLLGQLLLLLQLVLLCLLDPGVFGLRLAHSHLTSQFLKSIFLLLGMSLFQSLFLDSKRLQISLQLALVVLKLVVLPLNLPHFTLFTRQLVLMLTE